MTDEELEGLIGTAYAQVEMSPEAEERILANLLAAEADSVKGTGYLTGFSEVDGDGEKHAGDPVKKPVPSTGSSRRRTPGWRRVAPAAIAAVLLIGIFVGTNLRPSVNTADNAMPTMATEKAAEMDSAPEEAPAPAPEPNGEARGVSLVANDAGESYAVSDSEKKEYAEVIVLEDGRRFAIVDLYVPEELDPGELDWQPATLEATGDTVDVALLDDGTCLVLFEDEGDLFLATEL